VEPNWLQLPQMPLEAFILGLKQRNWTSSAFKCVCCWAVWCARQPGAAQLQ
jgi:hypothetical protein